MSQRNEHNRKSQNYVGISINPIAEAFPELQFEEAATLHSPGSLDVLDDWFFPDVVLDCLDALDELIDEVETMVSG